LDEVSAAKKDGRLPMEDHNARIIVCVINSDQAQEVGEATAQNAFHNMSYFGGSSETIRSLLKP
jgi:hypothetical protein